MVNIVGLVLMVASSAVSWYMIVTSTIGDNSGSSLSLLRSSVWKISLFYTLWAVYNRYLGGHDHENGHFSLGLLTVSCLLTTYFCSSSSSLSSSLLSSLSERNIILATKIPLMLSCGLVVLNFAQPIPDIISMKGPAKFGKVVWKGDTSVLAVIWGYIFTAYLVSNIVMWSYVLFQFYQLPVDVDVDVDADADAAASADTTDPTIDIGETDETDETEPLQEETDPLQTALL